MVKTASGIGHLVLVVVTTKGDIVMDNLTQTIGPWQSTNYDWLKIQSATDPKFWYNIKRPRGELARPCHNPPKSKGNCGQLAWQNRTKSGFTPSGVGLSTRPLPRS